MPKRLVNVTLLWITESLLVKVLSHTCAAVWAMSTVCAVIFADKDKAKMQNISLLTFITYAI